MNEVFYDAIWQWIFISGIISVPFDDCIASNVMRILWKMLIVLDVDKVILILGITPFRHH